MVNKMWLAALQKHRNLTIPGASPRDSLIFNVIWCSPNPQLTPRQAWGMQINHDGEPIRAVLPKFGPQETKAHSRPVNRFAGGFSYYSTI